MKSSGQQAIKDAEGSRWAKSPEDQQGCFQWQANRSQREQQKTEDLVMNTQATRWAAEDETMHQSMSKEVMNDHAGSGNKPADTSDRHQRQRNKDSRNCISLTSKWFPSQQLLPLPWLVTVSFVGGVLSGTSL